MSTMLCGCHDFYEHGQCKHVHGPSWEPSGHRVMASSDPPQFITVKNPDPGPKTPGSLVFVNGILVGLVPAHDQ